jgi:flagellar assembly protein FliH
MGAPAKFLFDVDFAIPEAEKERVAASAEVAVQIADAEARGYREGFNAAQREAKAESDRRTALACEEMSMAMRTVASRFADIEQRMETEAVDIAVAVARKLSAELIAAEPLTDILALVSDCFRHLTATPHLAVRINDSLYDETRARVEKLAHQSGFEGKLVILSSPDIETGDCKIEWADGGVTLERAAIDAKINELVGRYMASRGKTEIPSRSNS